MPIPGGVEVRQTITTKSHVRRWTADLEKSSFRHSRIISKVDRPVWEVTHLAVSPGIPRCCVLAGCPAGATGRQGHQPFVKVASSVHNILDEKEAPCVCIIHRIISVFDNQPIINLYYMSFLWIP